MIKKFKDFLIKESIFSDSEEGGYVEIKIVQNGLELHLTHEGISYLEENEVTENSFFDIFEGIQLNSEYIYHHDLGESGFGLTNAPGFTEGYYLNDQGDYECSSNDGEVYYYDNYMITSFIDVLKEDGKVFFDKVQ